jgi:hypothetical protein
MCVSSSTSPLAQRRHTRCARSRRTRAGPRPAGGEGETLSCDEAARAAADAKRADCTRRGAAASTQVNHQKIATLIKALTGRDFDKHTKRKPVANPQRPDICETILEIMRKTDSTH